MLGGLSAPFISLCEEKESPLPGYAGTRPDCGLRTPPSAARQLHSVTHPSWLGVGMSHSSSRQSALHLHRWEVRKRGRTAASASILSSSPSSPNTSNPASTHLLLCRAVIAFFSWSFEAKVTVLLPAFFTVCARRRTRELSGMFLVLDEIDSTRTHINRPAFTLHRSSYIVEGSLRGTAHVGQHAPVPISSSSWPSRGQLLPSSPLSSSAAPPAAARRP